MNKYHVSPELLYHSRERYSTLEMVAMRSSSVIINCLFSIWLSSCLTAASPTVKIKNGTLEGTVMRTRLGREFYAFRGIPYALPPVGELRFQPPQPAVSWTGVRLATKDSSQCTQKDVMTHQTEVSGVEDCLYLNVYSPKLPTANAENHQQGLPVMIWIHGGAWLSGAGDSFAFGPQFLLDRDVVLVSANYRLGAIGFLSTQDMASPGNYGMKDQVQVLRWVKENIAAFGGDPNSITIFGESAGAASVHYHLISPLSKGLFHRGISQSGSLLNPWVFTRPEIAKDRAQRLAGQLGCPTKNSTELVNCLRKIDAAEIINASDQFSIFDYDPLIPFRIVIEPEHPGAFLIHEPVEYLKSGNVADVSWMVGLNSHEGAIRASAILGLKKENFSERLNTEWMKLAPITLLLEDISLKESYEEDVKKIRDFYFGEKTIDESTKWELVDMYSDALENYGVESSIRYHLKGLSSPVYYYNFAYRGNSSFSTFFGDPVNEYGVCHGDELQYLFPVGEVLFPNTPLSAYDHKMIDILTSLWYNFAKSGNPTPEINQMIPLKWMPVRTEALEYLSIEHPHSMKMLSNFEERRMGFWRNLYPQKDLNKSNKQSLPKSELNVK